MRNRKIYSLSILGCFLAAALCGSMADAAVLYTSQLTAPPLTAGNLVGQDGWANHSGTGSLIQVGATGTTLVQGSGSREDANVSVTPISTGQTYYFGFDVTVTGGAITPVYFAHFKDTGSDFTTRVWVMPPRQGGGFTFGLSAASTTTISSWASDFAFGSTNRIIGSYNHSTLETKLWVNPVNSGSTSLSVVDTAPNAVSSFALRQATGESTQLITCLTVSDTFDEALTCIPEPTSIALLLGCVGVMVLRRK